MRYYCPCWSPDPADELIALPQAIELDLRAEEKETTGGMDGWKRGKGKKAGAGKGG